MSNILERFQKLCEEATEKERQNLWAILSAVRGPDSHTESWSLKQWTWMARGLICKSMFGINKGSIYYKTPPKPFDGENIDDFVDRMSGKMFRYNPRAQRHFVEHVAAALYIAQTLDKDSQIPTE